jgi:hypothetical protein
VAVAVAVAEVLTSRILSFWIGNGVEGKAGLCVPGTARIEVSPLKCIIEPPMSRIAKSRLAYILLATKSLAESH